jgi:uncharacterized protein with PhoU and TrkA domain
MTSVLVLLTYKDISVNKVCISPNWMIFHVGRSLSEVNTPDDEFWIVGVPKGKTWISLPRLVETINDGDKLVIYGEIKTVGQLFK